MKKYIIILLVIPVLLLIGANAKRPKTETKEAAVAATTPVVIKRSDAEIKKFWQDELNNTVVGILSGKSPYSEINSRFLSANLKGIHINLSIEYHWASKKVGASSGFEQNGSPSISVYVPSLMDTFQALKSFNRPNWKEVFLSHVTIIFMHETEHLRNPKTTRPDHIDLDEESRAWADTCKYTIDPMVSNYKVDLISSEIPLYRAWKQCNGNSANPIWTSTMQTVYGTVDGKTKN